MKEVSKNLLRKFWRGLVIPILRILPGRLGLKFFTIAHYFKIVFWHGQVINFQFGRADFDSNLVEKPLSSDLESCQLVEPTDQGVVPPGLVPPWVIPELYDIAQIEPQLYPTMTLINKFSYWCTPVEVEPGGVYKKCLMDLGGYSPKIIILVPWIIRGGADRGVLHHAAAAVKAGMDVLVISTEDKESQWANKLPAEAKFLEFGRIARESSEDIKKSVLARLLLQSSANKIHVINSRLGWDIIRDYGKSLNSVKKSIFASVFCDDYEDGVPRSYPQAYLVQCWPYLKGLICDSFWYPKELVRQYGASPEKIHTVYFPVSEVYSSEYKSVNCSRVLWTGRFARQKRIDLLIKIAQLLPEITFDVYGYAELDHEREIERQMDLIENISVRGSFDSMSDLVSQNDYSLFLFTSAWEGLPLTLLDITMVGLPIVASMVGGVPEFINEETGYPVCSIDDPVAYVQRIQEAMSDDVGRREKWMRAADLACSRHSVDKFLARIHEIPGYLD